MPYPNEHACRVRPPSDFQPNTFRRIHREADGKPLDIIIGRPKGQSTTDTQAFRYPIRSWTADQARAHCQRQGGRFEAATNAGRGGGGDDGGGGGGGGGGRPPTSSGPGDAAAAQPVLAAGGLITTIPLALGLEDGQDIVLRAAAPATQPLRVDREAGIIRGVSVIERGPALGHDFDNDDETLRQVIELGNRNPLGIKVRLSHPDACNDGTGRELGRNRNHRLSDDGQRVLADYHRLEAASRAPDGNLTGWLFDVAEEDPAIIGLSIHARGKAQARVDENGDPIIVDGVKARPVLRITKLLGEDVVDMPAANRGGLFASAADWGGQLLEEAIPLAAGDQLELDQLAGFLAEREELVALAHGIDIAFETPAGQAEVRLDSPSTPAELDRLAGFINRHLDRRGIRHPALNAEAVRRIVTRLQEPETMPPDNPANPTTEPAATHAANTPPETPPNPQPTAQATAPPAPAAPPADEPSQARLDERQRIRDIRALTQSLDGRGIDLASLEEKAIADGTSLDGYRRQVLDRLVEAEPPTGVGSLEIGPTSSEKLRAQATDSILLAHNVALVGDSVDKRRHAAEASGLGRLGPQQLARICLHEAGVRNVDRMSSEELFDRTFGAFALQAVGHGSGDFPLILADSANKAMLQGYNLSPVTWDRWCRIGNLKDFKTASRLRLSESPLLEVRAEGEPAAEGTFNEQREQITLQPYAKAVSYTRTMFINDDLGAFVGLAERLGAGANYTVEVQVYTNLTLNTRTGPTMSDSTVLFTAGHGNLAGTGAVPSQATLEAAILAMMTQAGVGQDGASVTIGVAPSVYFAAPNVATTIEKIIRSQFAGSDARRDPQIAELTDAVAIKVPQLVPLGATTDWYAVAPQNLAPSYEVGFLNGQRTPRTIVVNRPTVDGTTIIVHSDFAVFPTGGWQGIYRNPGA